ncbi:MAG: tetratricopeptide repeat protein [Deltaproteobacteria bacterium]|nr:tetratricopeptide repeat protein [Deltaproteobacteria bacterium]
MRKLLLGLSFLGLIGGVNVVQAAGPLKRQVESVADGNRLYGERHFEQALERYEDAEKKFEAEPSIQFDRGSALFKLGRSKEAREAFLRALGTEDRVLKTRNYYNIGNTFLAEKAYKDSMVYYRRALELDPAFDDARYNLELALMALAQQEEQKQPDDSDKGDKKQEQDKKKEDKKDQSEKKKDQRDEGDSEKGEGDKDKQDQKDKKDQDEKDQKDKKDQDEQDQDKKDQDKKDQDKKDQDKKDQDKKDQDKKDQDKKDQDKKDQDKKDQDKKDQDKKDQDKQDQQGQPEDQQADQRQSSRSSASDQEPGRLSKQQVRDLLDAMRDNEKPFQMHKFLLPEFNRRNHDRDVKKDW